MKNDFLEILRRLTQAEVSFVLIGGFAGTVYGCTMLTQDIDVCCDFSTENLTRLQKALADVHPVHRMNPNRKPFEQTEDAVKGLKNLYLDTDLGTLDCIGFVEGVGGFKDVIKVSMVIETEGMKLNVLTLDALIKSKEAMRRPRDRQAVIQLKTIREQTGKNEK